MPNPPNDGSHRDVFNPYTGSGGWQLLLENNIFYDIWLFSFLMQESRQMGNIVVRGNVFCKGGGHVIRFGSGNGGVTSVLFEHNTFYNIPDYQGPSSQHRNNIYAKSSNWIDAWGASSDVHRDGSTSSCLFWTNPSDFADVNDPLGPDGIPWTADDGFRLNAGSEAIGAASDGTDIGAYQFESGGQDPVVSVTPSSLDFGSLIVGSTLDLTLTVQNTGSGTLSGSASVAAPFSVVSGAAYSLGANESQSVTVRYSPSAAGNHAQNVSFSGGGGATVSVNGAAANGNLPPTVSSVTQDAADADPGTPGLQVFESTTLTYSATASDPNGDIVSWQWIYTVNGGSEVVHAEGSGPVTPASFTYGSGVVGSTYVWTLRADDGEETSESQLPVTVIGLPTARAGSPIEAESGILTSPFESAGGVIYQSVGTGVSTGGRAVYSFVITNAGEYVIFARVDAPSLTANSFYVDIDEEPEDPHMAWDVLPPTTGFEERYVSWRGSGTADDNEFEPKVFSLSEGVHQLILRGREANTQLDRFVILPQVPGKPGNLREVSRF